MPNSYKGSTGGRREGVKEGGKGKDGVLCHVGGRFYRMGTQLSHHSILFILLGLLLILLRLIVRFELLRIKSRIRLM